MSSDPLHKTTREQRLTPPTYDIVAQLRDPNTRLAGDVATMARAATEIERLRAVIRVNGLRHGATDAEIDEVIYGKR